MAQFINHETSGPPHDAMAMMGQPLSMWARTIGYEHCKQMGLIGSLAMQCTNAVAEQLERDKPFEAMQAGMQYLDLTGVYRLFAALLCTALEERMPIQVTPEEDEAWAAMSTTNEVTE
jgi:hypothetical protein